MIRFFPYLLVEAAADTSRLEPGPFCYGTEDFHHFIPLSEGITILMAARTICSSTLPWLKVELVG
jgi:hypothetical protein